MSSFRPEVSAAAVSLSRFGLVIWTTDDTTGLAPEPGAATLFVPSCNPESGKWIMSPQEILLGLGVLGPRERLIFRMSVYDVMRLLARSSRSALRGQSVLIDQRVHKGNIDTKRRRRETDIPNQPCVCLPEASPKLAVTWILLPGRSRSRIFFPPDEKRRS